jgi:hypothetical protein
MAGTRLWGGQEGKWAWIAALLHSIWIDMGLTDRLPDEALGGCYAELVNAIRLIAITFHFRKTSVPRHPILGLVAFLILYMKHVLDRQLQHLLQGHEATSRRSATLLATGQSGALESSRLARTAANLAKQIHERLDCAGRRANPASSRSARSMWTLTRNSPPTTASPRFRPC